MLWGRPELGIWGRLDGWSLSARVTGGARLYYTCENPQYGQAR